MYLKLLKNDFKKNPWNNGILLMFITLAALIVVTVTLMLTQLFTAITSMYKTANPPHFLQMHRGELPQESIDEFNSTYEGIEHWQTVPMITLYGDEITVLKEDGSRFSLSDCRLDISFVRQNEDYDVLLDRYREPLVIHSGEIGVPVILLEKFDIGIGDTVTLSSRGAARDFTVAAYVYDGQMNSTLCSSTRFLISDADFQELCGSAGETEYLIEAWFTDSAQAADYQTAYENSSRNLPKNGQAITYTMIFLLSALTDMLMAMVFLLAGVLLLVIALVCLRYAVLAELEEDMREIGSMKAIGIPQKGICNLYLGKIRILTAAGCILGLVLAFFTTAMLTGHISGTFGSQPQNAMGPCLSILAIILVYGIILLFGRKILRRLGKATIMDLMVTEKGFGRSRKVRDGLSKSKWLPVNLLMGFHEVRRGYGIVFGLLLVVSFLISVPLRTVQTMEQEDFVTYMGSPVCNLLLEVEPGEALEERNQAAETILLTELSQGAVAQIDAQRRVRLQAIGDNGEVVGIHIDSGQRAGAGLKYLVGKNPQDKGDIALSWLMADELGKTAGDSIRILTGDGTQEFTVCGIYQDVTSGGRTAKTICDFPFETSERFSYALTLTETDKEAFAAGLRNKLGAGYSVEDMEEFLGQTLGGVTAQVRRASFAIVFIGIWLTVLITALFLKLRMAREQMVLAAKKAMGIPLTAILLQELYPVLFAGGFGAVCGVFFAEVFGDHLISGLFGLLEMGLKKITFAPIPALQLLLIPVLLLITLGAVTIGICAGVRHMDVASHINE